MNHQITVCKTSMTNIRQGNFHVATPLRPRKPWTERRFQLSQLITIRNTLVTTGLAGGTDGTAKKERSPEGVKHHDWLGVIGWPFWPKLQLFRRQRAQCVKESGRRRQILNWREGHNGKVVFSELRDCVYKSSQGPAEYFGSQSKWRNYYCRGMKCEKGRGK